MVTAAMTDSTGIQYACSGSSDDRNTRANAANAAAFTLVDMNAVTMVGAPSYASGVHMWKGTADTLNAKPTASSATASIASVACGAEAIAVPIWSSRVEPAIVNANAMPYRQNPPEKPPRRTYLNPASAPPALS